MLVMVLVLMLMLVLMLVMVMVMVMMLVARHVAFQRCTSSALTLKIALIQSSMTNCSGLCRTR